MYRERGVCRGLTSSESCTVSDRVWCVRRTRVPLPTLRLLRPTGIECLFVRRTSNRVIMIFGEVPDLPLLPLPRNRHPSLPTGRNPLLFHTRSLVRTGSNDVVRCQVGTRQNPLLKVKGPRGFRLPILLSVHPFWVPRVSVCSTRVLDYGGFP